MIKEDLLIVKINPNSFEFEFYAIKTIIFTNDIIRNYKKIIIIKNFKNTFLIFYTITKSSFT